MYNLLQMENHAAKTLSQQPQVIADEERPVVQIDNLSGLSEFILVCEHASNFIPSYFSNLGLSDEVVSSHVAWDPGAFGVAQQLSDHFDATLVSSKVSRLVYDNNRPPDDASAMPKQSEIYQVPGNCDITEEEKFARIDQIYHPFQDALSKVIATKKLKHAMPLLVTIHSFTPVYFGKRRDVELGILHSEYDSKFADHALSAANEVTDLKVERNQPYGPKDGVSHTLIEHGVKNSIPNVMLEIKNDLISTSDQINQISVQLAQMLHKAVKNLEQVA